MIDLTMTRATLAPTSAISDYLRKRRTSEGSRKRRLSNTSDTPGGQLDAENAQIWWDVLTACFLQIGVSPPPERVHARGTHGRRLALARGAAFVICHAEYGIPAARLAELAGITHTSVGSWIRGRRAEEVAPFVARWCAGVRQERTSFAEITTEAAAALARESDLTGIPAEVLASAAILAACPK